jgi:hypothetical protein
VSLDDLIGNRTYREAGVSLMMDVEYTNKDPTDYWRWPVGAAVKYRYRVRKMNFGEDSRFKLTKWHHLARSEDSRVLYTAFGVLIVVIPHGELGYLNPFGVALGVSGFLALMRLADLFITRVLVQVYKLVPSLHYVWVTLAYYSKEHSPSDDLVRMHMREDGNFDEDRFEGDLHQMKEHANRAYWRKRGRAFRERQDRFEAYTVFYSAGFFVLILSAAFSEGGRSAG